jgi:hypothetical protein
MLGVLRLYLWFWKPILIAEIGFLVHVERRVRGWISILVWLLVAMPEARSAFLVEFQNKRESVQAHSVLSANTEGVILRPVGGGFGNGVRHRWDEFSARTLGVLMSELLEDPLFNQKSREVKFKIMESLEVARRSKAPEKPTQPFRPPSPQPVAVTNAPSPPAINPATGIPTPQPAVVPTNSLPALPKPTGVAPVKPVTQPATNVAPAPTSVFQLTEPPGVAPFPGRRPPASGLSSEVMFNPSGIFLALLVMALSGYAGYEIARFKKRPVKLVCALSAMLPVLGPAVFLALPPQNSGEATQFASPGVPGAPDIPGTTPPTPLPAVKELKYEDDPDSPYANLPAGGVEETQFVEEPVAAPPAVAKSLEHYHGSEYEFTPAFFSQYFAQFVGAAATTGEALILRSNSVEYPVHYISSVDATGLRIIYAANGQWVEEFLTYTDLAEVEVLGHA